jgi:hypothetical protein
MNIKEQYVKETGNQAIIDDDYFDWLEQKAEKGAREPNVIQ